MVEGEVTVAPRDVTEGLHDLTEPRVYGRGRLPRHLAVAIGVQLSREGGYEVITTSLLGATSPMLC